ncbi:hypothetical protein [Streptomyces sp. NPDC058294]|uniref:hypothetical protein n=1 Tax=Streptomyces sp. NPDC058294 TaxID=3346430 RepID=UPI0036E4A0FF
MTGTPGWISPEQYSTGEVASEADIFAWGALIAYAATGRLPFGSGAADVVAFRVLSAEPDLNGVPDDLRPLVEQSLSKEPSGRPTAIELAQTSTELLASQTTTVLPGAGAVQQPTLVADLISLNWNLPVAAEPGWPTPPRDRNRMRMYLAATATAAVLGGLGGAIAASQSSDTEQGKAPAASGASTVTADGAAAAAQGSPSQAENSTAPASEVPTATPHTLEAAPAPAYTRTDNAQPTIDEWAAARVPVTPAEKIAAQHLIKDAAPVLKGQNYMGDDVVVTFNPQAQTMFVTFGPGTFPEGQDYQEDPNWTDIRRGLMFGSCSEAQQDFHNDITWPYGRAVVVYRESMASPLIADFRDATHIDSCRV